MSLAGIRSNRGDAYQRSVAVYWIVNMLTKDEIVSVQVDSVGLPGEAELVYGDDIVLISKDRNKTYIQAKVNQTDHHFWRLSDSVLREELLSAKKQLTLDPNCLFCFYSRTPFGVFQRLIEEACLFSGLAEFKSVAAQNVKTVLAKLSEFWSVDEHEAFCLCRRIKIGEHNAVNSWEEVCIQLLEPICSNPELTYELLWSYIDHQHSKLGEPQYLIDRESVLKSLESKGVYLSGDFDEESFLKGVHSFSSIGRQWSRSIGGEKIPRQECNDLIQAIEDGVTSVLLEDVAGGGKTCVLLDVVDHLESSTGKEFLFIRGDLFASITSLEQLSEHGLPSDLVAQVSRYSSRHKFTVIIDSLDVLALGRSHHSLAIFLGLIAELENLPNVTVIASSRSFDAKYDPLLREKQWARKVHLRSLDYDADVSPFLIKLGVDHDGLSKELQTLLIIPQNLKLFYTLIEHGQSPEEIQANELHDNYIQTVVAEDQLLGNDVVSALEVLAQRLLDDRSYQFSDSLLSLSNTVIQRLLSSDVLTRVTSNQLMFSHQTLADAMRVRLAMKSGNDLTDFVLSQAQLPFVRPSVRTYALQLRSDERQYTKQLLRFINSDEVAAHLKRLVIETLAESTPRDSDAMVLIRISRSQPLIFNRFLDAANGDEWFELLERLWFPRMNVDVDRDVLIRFFSYASKFKASYPMRLLAIWHQAIDEEWMHYRQLLWSVGHSIEDFGHWNEPEFYRLLKRLLDMADDDRDSLGNVISQYVECTNSGDALLWEYITKGSKSPEEVLRGREIQLNCDRHTFIDEEFLTRRLQNSDELLQLALSYLERFGEEGLEKYGVDLLYDTSWARRHSGRGMHSHDSFLELMSSVEKVLKVRVGAGGDALWHDFQERVSTSPELGLRYLLLEGFRINVSDNIAGISRQLTDPDLLKQGSFRYEISELVSCSFPYLTNEIQDQYQRVVIDMHSDDGEAYWIYEKKYELLVCIPSIYRNEETNQFIEMHIPWFGALRADPDKSSTGGYVSSPVSSDTMREFSNEWMIKVLRHYDGYYAFADQVGSRLLGDMDSITQSLRTAASLEPMRFLPLIELIQREGLSSKYIVSILEGISDHLNSRFGNSSYQSWREIEPLPDGYELALTLLGLIEKYGGFDKRGYCLTHAVQACSFILETDNEIDRLCFQLWVLSTSSSPEEDKDVSSMGLMGTAINSVRGIAAESVLVLSNRLIDQERNLPKELIDLLVRYSKDVAMPVRAGFVRRFPYFHSRVPDLGWELLDNLFNGSDSLLWKELEQSLYYQYSQSFEKVDPYLNRYLTSDSEGCHEAWGRLAALSYFAGHLTEDELFEKAASACTKSCWVGIGQVFSHNLVSTKQKGKCIKGLSRLFDNSDVAEIYTNLDLEMSKRDLSKVVPISLAAKFVRHCPVNSYRDFDGLLVWASIHVMYDFLGVLEIFEVLLDRLSQADEPVHLYRSDDLVVALKVMLQEADMSDDIELIDRILSLQDKFMGFGVDGIQEIQEGY